MTLLLLCYLAKVVAPRSKSLLNNMPLASAISRVPQRWVMCMLCSLALAGVNFRDSYYHETYKFVQRFTLDKPRPTGGCPYFYYARQSVKNELPFHLPDVYLSSNILDLGLSVFRIGKCLSAVPAGLLSDLGYTRYVLGGGMILVTITNILLPTVTELGVTVYMINSIVEGIGEGTILPSVISLISCWTLSTKRNTFTVLVVVGLYYGSTLGHIFFHLNYEKTTSSWSFGKYSNGTYGIVWLIFWFIFGYHSPAFSPFVTQQDQATVTSHRRPPLVKGLKTLREIPWKKIISSSSFLSFILLFCSLQWIVISNINDILEGYDQYILMIPEQFSVRSSIVTIFAFPTSLMGGLLSDWVIKRELISNTNIKKILVFKSVLLSSMFIVSATFVGCNYILFWIMADTAVYAIGLADSAVFTSPIDLSPQNAGLLMGIMYGAKTIVMLIDFSIEGLFTPDPFDEVSWQLKSILHIIVAFVLVIPFFVFGSAEKQHWVHSGRLNVTNSPTELETYEDTNT